MTDNQGTDVTADVDPADGRDESMNERMDRNWNEILQELRVTQTGTQIFTGFLLTIAFQTRFTELTTFQVRVYLVLVVAAVLTTALGLAPVSLHRSLFRKGAKMIIVETAHVFMRITLVGVAVMLRGAKSGTDTFWKDNMTWNSGFRLKSRCGRSSSTSFSNDRS